MLVFCYYNFDELVLGKCMEEYLCFVVCYWYIFCWNGVDMFGVGVFNCLWQQFGEVLVLVKCKVDVVFEFFYKLYVLFYCFYDVDVFFEGVLLKEYINNFV